MMAHLKLYLDPLSAHELKEKKKKKNVIKFRPL